MFSQSSECNIEYECLCTETETCGTQEGYGTSPFCATMGQPLIYYCQTSQQKPQQRCGNVRKDNRNCFTKAFQWYTKEHVPHRDEHTRKSGDVKGFANWLDSKYDQFLQDQCDTCSYKVKHTSITEAYMFQNEPEIRETRRKKFRVKSPWRKKRGHKDTGDVTSKSSLHYILKPKDISRPASETNETSKAMMMSSEVVLSRYSHSCTSLRVLRESSVAVVKRNQEAAQSSMSIKPKKNATKSLSKINTVEQKAKDVVCLCSKVSKRNVTTQSDPWPAKSPSKSVPKVETHSQTLPKSESPVQPAQNAAVQPAQNAAPCPCRPSKFTKISHPTKIEIEFETKRSLAHMESTICQCSKENIPKTDAQCQFQTDFMTCSCGSDHSIKHETIQIMPQNVRLHPCECVHINFEKSPVEPPLANSNFEKCPLEPPLANSNFEKWPLEPPLANSNQNQPYPCNQCIPCKRATIITDDGKISNRSNKTTPGPNGLVSNPSNKKTTGCDGILTTNPTTNDGVQTSNQTTVANDGAQTSNHSIRIDKNGAAAHPLFMKIVFADKLCKF